MTHEQLPQDCLLLAQDAAGNFAMACIVFSRIVTAHHVARGNPVYLSPRTGESAQATLEIVAPGRDLAISTQQVLKPGFEALSAPIVGQKLTILGFHGQQNQPFSIEVVVTEVLATGRAIVQRLGGADAQVGMSGSAVVTEQGELVGLLVEGVAGSNGQALYLETVPSVNR